MCLARSEAKQTETSEFGAEKGLFQGHAGRWVACATQTPKLIEGFQQSTFKGKVRGEVGCQKLLGVGILCSRSCPHRSHQGIPVNLQGHKCYSPLCNFLSLCDWKSVIPLKVRTLRMGFLYVSGYRQHAFYKRCRVSMTQQRPRGTDVQVKENRSSMCSYLFTVLAFTLLMAYF